MQKALKISVFFPAYNEEDNLKRTVTNAQEILNRLKADYEIIIVNDGSKDKTGEVAAKLAKENKKIRVITHSPNRGYGGALISGFYSARKDIIAFNDSDGQFDFEEISRFLPKLEEADLVIGYRVNRAEGWKRQLLAQALRIWDLLLFGIWYKDIDCAFKVIKRNSLMRLPKLFTSTAMISTELLVKAKRAGLIIVEVPVTHLPDLGDKNRRARGGHPKIILKAVKGTIDLWRSLRSA
jgi:glycosyltransferase involved in cell wall biosynthesis